MWLLPPCSYCQWLLSACGYCQHVIFASMWLLSACGYCQHIVIANVVIATMWLLPLCRYCQYVVIASMELLPVCGYCQYGVIAWDCCQHGVIASMGYCQYVVIVSLELLLMYHIYGNTTNYTYTREELLEIKYGKWPPIPLNYGVLLILQVHAYCCHRYGMFTITMCGNNTCQTVFCIQIIWYNKNRLQSETKF